MRFSCTFFFLLNLQQVWTDFLYDNCIYWTSSEGFGLPEFTERRVLNDVTVYYHDSTLKSKTPSPDWINTTTGKDEWNKILFWSDHNRITVNLGFQTATQQFNLTGSLSGQNLYQASGCCSLHPDGTYSASLTSAFNGKDFTSFDFNSKTFVAAVPQAVLYKRQREKEPFIITELAAFYKNTCLEQLKILQQAPGVQIKKVPEVRILEKKKAGSITVTCHVTGFYPREVQVVWLGPDLQPGDEGFTEVLPNEDGTYQTRRSVIVPEEDTGKHTYSCVVRHISVPHNITTAWVGVKTRSFAVWIFLICISLLGSGLGVWLGCKKKP